MLQAIDTRLKTLQLARDSVAWLELPPEEVWLWHPFCSQRECPRLQSVKTELDYSWTTLFPPHKQVPKRSKVLLRSCNESLNLSAEWKEGERRRDGERAEASPSDQRRALALTLPVATGMMLCFLTDV